MSADLQTPVYVTTSTLCQPALPRQGLQETHRGLCPPGNWGGLPCRGRQRWGVGAVGTVPLARTVPAPFIRIV